MVVVIVVVVVVMVVVWIDCCLVQSGSSATLFESVHKKLFALPAACVVYPAHDYLGRTASTIGEGWF